MKAFKSFQISRAFSSAGDEMWVTVLPVFLATQGFGAKTIGIVFSSGAFGSLLGILLIPVFCHRFKSAMVAFGADIAQLLVFLSLGVFFLLSDNPLRIEVWAVVQFALLMLESLWFGASETLMTRISDSSTAQTTHKWNAVSASVGPTVGPVLGGMIYQFAGMVSLAILNSISFSWQAVSLLFLRRSEPPGEKQTSSNLLTNLKSGTSLVWSDARLRYLTLMPVVVKVFLLGALPFVAFRLTSLGLPASYIGLLLATIAIGSLLGAITYRPCDSSQLHLIYARDSFILLIVMAILNGLIYFFPNAIALSASTLMAGVFVARYSIELRVLRQMVVSRENMPTVVSSQGFLARIATPLSGLIFGALLSIPPGLIQIAVILVFVAFGLYGLFKTRDAYEVARVGTSSRKVG